MYLYIFAHLHHFLALSLLLLCVPPLRAHTPAQPSNNSFQAVNTSSFLLQSYTGSDREHLASLSVRNDSISGGLTQGIFVHFTEERAGSNDTTTTPWIAFVCCDGNSTNSSQESDIFTMAWSRGAKSAILYSLYSETCVISPGYHSPVLDIFATRSLDASLHIEYEFGQFGPSSEKYYGYFNATMLNDAAGLLNDSITVNYPTAPGFIFATLQTDNANGTGPTGSGNSGNSQNTGIAMIVLYAITGCVSALFCAVIISGAIRAIRYPERYGPRAADPTLGGGQSRARGLGRAILDTFPVVKFGSGNGQGSNLPRPKDVESMPMSTEFDAPLPVTRFVQLSQLNPIADQDEQLTRHDGFGEGAIASAAGQGTSEDPQASEGTNQADVMPPRRNGAEHEADAGMPESIGRETCPICIMDFEEGDDLRVLPCEGKHRFHQSCVDPWLLELSASCPICRQDFRALETIISGESDGEPSSPTLHSAGGISTTQNRFSRYLRFARRRQRGSISRDEISPPSPTGS